MNDEKTRYVSVGFYPARNYEPCVEFGGPTKTPVILTSYCQPSRNISRKCVRICVRMNRTDAKNCYSAFKEEEEGEKEEEEEEEERTMWQNCRSINILSVLN